MTIRFTGKLPDLVDPWDTYDSRDGISRSGRFCDNYDDESNVEDPLEKEENVCCILSRMRVVLSFQDYVRG